jgi:DNA-binding transcriptional ArsR family regulator
MIVEQGILWHARQAVKHYSHPAMRDVKLPAIMQALSDPGRLAVVRELLQARGRALACHEVRLKVSKATKSHHFEVLRAAGIIFTKMEGTESMTSLRKTELNKHFPGLLKLLAAGK